MRGVWKRPAAILSLFLGLCASALAHTADISTARIVGKPDKVYLVDEGFLATDLERMFQASMAERAGANLAEPGVLETEIGRFVSRRVSMRDAGGRVCASHVEKSGEDPANADSALVVLRFDCAGTTGPHFYDAARLLVAQGAKGKHLVTLEGANAGETLLYPADPPLDLSKPLETTWQLMKKFGAAGVEHIVTGYDHVCFLVALILWSRKIWPVVKIVTAFTISHSITLSLAALNIFALPSTLTESLIAASIIFVAVENYFSRNVDKRWRVTFLFGFIHGFGFASALTEMGVPQHAVVPALAAFNIGVEFGQIVIVLTLIPMMLGVDTMTKGGRSPKFVYAVSSVIALFGAYWLLQRVGVLPG